jgi:hypothetical protein
VFVGGWATRLYRLSERVADVPFGPLLTDDADIALPEGLWVPSPTVHESLTAAGFVESMTGDDVPPVTRYVAPQRDFEVEFIAHQTGGVDESSGPGATTLVGGVSAQRLGNVRLLLEEPWSVIVATDAGYPVGDRGLVVRVPNPASFIAQKLLAIRRRGRSGPKDVLYVHDTLQLFADHLGELREVWNRVRARMGPSITERLWARWSFVKEHPELLRRASTIAEESGRPAPPSPTRIEAACELGLSEVFAKDRQPREKSRGAT